MGTDSHAFGSWRLRGGRYEQPGLPVEVLAEFARYERLVVDVARGLYKQRNTSRQRVPGGFASSFSLRLSDIQVGSVRPVLERTVTDTDGLFGKSEVDIFEEARRLIQEVFRSVEAGSGIPRNFPPQALREFSTFGRSLREEEFIEFDGGTSDVAIYSQAVRRRIHEQARLEKFEIERLVDGQITGLYPDRRTFDFRLARSEKVIPGRYSSDDLLMDLKQYLDYSATAPTVAVSAVAIQATDEEITEIQDVLAVEPVLPADWWERLGELRGLEAGWLDGVGRPVSRRVLRAVELLLLEFLDQRVRRPYIYPTEEGGVQLEWPYPAGEVTLVVMPDEQVEACAFSKEDDRERESVFRWGQLNEIAEFVSGGIAEYGD
ncbi:hypothetical protein ACIQ8G_03090 [Streptomyces sp. NPDC094154]|uniref:hypothetical protein n=1 Tax=Streptomyces sp. NPDC094154 TaxID=3366059 RepID=UPI0038141251